MSTAGLAGSFRPACRLAP
uniref:Uncharacterized protein n=1 Tax=Arundo donax TaxID=35708 RepID=A0A0A8ZY86_ARUDO